jgi:hypothetical protein
MAARHSVCKATKTFPKGGSRCATDGTRFRLAELQALAAAIGSRQWTDTTANAVSSALKKQRCPAAVQSRGSLRLTIGNFHDLAYQRKLGG